MTPASPNLRQLFDAQIQCMATTLRPGTIGIYRAVVKCFLDYLEAAYPEVDRLCRLRRDPHMVGWLRSLCERPRPYKNGTRIAYLVLLRRLIDNLATERGDVEEGLIVRDDFPPVDRYLPMPLSAKDDRLLHAELRKTGDLKCTGLLLLRATGMRIGECMKLSTDCLRELGQRQWVLRVPLGKLHTERWIPVDDNIRQLIARITSLREESAPAQLSDLLFPQPKGHKSACTAMRKALKKAARRGGCSEHITPHRLRHSFATEMLRAGVSLPAVMQLLGHKSVLMTMRYILVSQNDLQQQYHRARENISSQYSIPKLPIPKKADQPTSGIPAISAALAEVNHLLAMYMTHLNDGDVLRDLQRIARRLTKIAKKMNELDSQPK